MLDAAEVRPAHSGENGEFRLRLTESETPNPDLKPILTVSGPQIQGLMETHGTIHFLNHFYNRRIAVGQESSVETGEMGSHEPEKTQ